MGKEFAVSLFARRFAMLFLASLFVVGPFGFAASVAQRPETSIAMLQKAINARDLALAEQYLDIDGVITKIIDILLTEEDVAKSLNNGALTIGLALAISSDANTAAAFKEFLQSEAREYVRHGVVSGAFSGALVKNASTYGGLIKKTFRGKEKDKIAFGPASVLSRKVESAMVTTTLTRGDNGRAYPLKLRLERQSGVWRVVELINTRDIIQKAIKKDAK